MTGRTGLLGGLVVLVGMMIVFVWKGHHARALVAEVESLKAGRQRLLNERDRMRAEALTLSHVDRIKELATRELGLVEPTQTPVDVPPITSLGSTDSLAASRATGTEDR